MAKLLILGGNGIPYVRILVPLEGLKRLQTLLKAQTLRARKKDIPRNPSQVLLLCRAVLGVLLDEGVFHVEHVTLYSWEEGSGDRRTLPVAIK